MDESSNYYYAATTSTGATTLADTLLEDLDDLSDNNEEEDYDENDQRFDHEDGDLKLAAANDNRNGDVQREHQDQHPYDRSSVSSAELKIKQNGSTLTTSASSTRIKKRRLLENPSLQKHLQAIQLMMNRKGNSDYDNADEYESNTNNDESSSSSWILNSNQQLAAVVHELQECHAELRLAYRPKFPELEDLIPNLLQYKHVVATIANDPDVAHVVMERLQHNQQHSNNNTSFTTTTTMTNANTKTTATATTPASPQTPVLSNNQIITLSVAASTTLGRMLTDEEFQRVQVELQYMDQLFHVQHILTQFVQERMQFIAPTMCALLGSTTLVAQLMGLAGGSLSDLAKIPACNLQVLGRKQQQQVFSQQQQQQSSSSLLQPQSISITATAASSTHMGCLAQCDLVMTMCPKPLQKKALKIVAAKLALAIRMDHVAHTTTSPTPAARAAATSQGLAFRQDILHKIQAWQEPQKAMVLKALPKPDLTIKKRRGGKRMRRLKERYEETALMKQANTRSFSGPTGEYGDDAMGLTMGLLDAGGEAAVAETVGGNLRKHAVEKRKFRQANTKASRKRAAQMSAVAAQATSAGSSSGLASSMVFTPVQGMELVDPEANRDRVREANRKWFTEHGGFQSALPPKK